MSANNLGKDPIEALSAYLDGEASPEEALWVEELLENDQNMRDEKRAMESVNALLAGMPQEEMRRSVVGNVLDKINKQQEEPRLVDKIIAFFKSYPLVPAGAAVALAVVGFVMYSGGGSPPAPDAGKLTASSQNATSQSEQRKPSGGAAQSQKDQDPSVILEKIFQQSEKVKSGNSKVAQTAEEKAAGKTLLDILKNAKSNTGNAGGMQAVSFGARLGAYTKSGGQELESIFIAFDRKGQDGGASLPKLETTAPPANCDITGLVKGTHGAYTINMEIAPSGEVASVNVTSGDASNPHIQALTSAAKTWKFRPAQSGAKPLTTKLQLQLPSEK